MLVLLGNFTCHGSSIIEVVSSVGAQKSLWLSSETECVYNGLSLI